MDSRLSFLLLVLVISFVSTNARSLVTLDDFGKWLKLKVIKTLMKGCEEVGSYVQQIEVFSLSVELSSINEQDLNVCRFPFQCKKLVLQYVPSILIDAEKFLETTDVCTAIYACKNSEDHIASMLADM
ncbi:hypothetical protein GW17_00004543 [Ensete ventricosum]|nr:hypothetical protein GW17_00004543 [Ensete ventricosum]